MKQEQENVVDLSQLKLRFERQQRFAGEALDRLAELASRHSAKDWPENKVHKMARRVQSARQKLDEATMILLEIDAEIERRADADAK